MWARGRGPLYSAAGLNLSDGSTASTGMARVRLLSVEQKEEQEEQEEQEEYLVKAEDVAISSSDTFYWCSVHKLPQQFEQKHHVLR